MLTADFQFCALKTCLLEQAQRADAAPPHKARGPHPAQSRARLCLPQPLRPFQGRHVCAPQPLLPGITGAQQLSGLTTGFLRSPELNPPGSGDLLLSMLLTDASV